MKLGFTPLALRELDEILDYIAVRAPTGARRVHARFRRIFDLIAQNPEIGRRTSNARLRRLPTSPYPYVVFYEVQGDRVVIIGVRHTARDPESMPDN